MGVRFVDLIRTLAEPAQAIEDATLDLYMGFFLPGAVGFRLDLIGRRVGQLREGMSDEDYRTAILAKIAVNRSTGTYADVIRRVLLKFVPRYDRLESGGGVLFLDIGQITLERAQFVFKFMVKAIEATVRLQIYYMLTDAEHSFTFAEGVFFVGAETAGGPKAIAVVGASALPDSGSLIVGLGTPDEETITYTSRDENFIYGVTLTNAQPAGVVAQIDNDEAKGFGDEADPLFGGLLAGVLTS